MEAHHKRIDSKWLGLVLAVVLGAGLMVWERAASPLPTVLAATDSETDPFSAKLRAVEAWLKAGRGQGNPGGSAQFCADCEVAGIACGDAMAETLAAGDCQLGDGSFVDTWGFTLSETETVKIDFTSTEFATFLFLTDRNCLILDSAGDCGAGDGACITMELPPGDYFVSANTLTGGETGAYNVSFSCIGGGASLLPGDVNADTRFNIADPISHLNFLFSSGPVPGCFANTGGPEIVFTEAGEAMLDWNDDGRINISDAIGSLNFLFGSGDPHALGRDCAIVAGECESNCTDGV